MNLPNYFLADLPAEAELTPGMLTEACQTLRRNRARYLAVRSTQSMIRILARVAEDWLDDEYPFRKLALKYGPAETGFSAATIKQGLGAFFSQLTGENLEALLVQELGHVQRLDAMVAAPNEGTPSRAAMATGPELLLHIAAGNLPNPTLMSMVHGLLLRSAQVVKCARGASLLPRLFAHSLYEVEPKLGACIELAEWRGGDTALEAAVFAEVQCVTATGSDETLAAVRQRLPKGVRFVGYGHRVSFGYVTHAVATGWREKKIIAAAANDVVAWDQQGCLSPHVFYVEDDGRGTALHFAEHLAVELALREAHAPRGTLTTELSAAIANRRAFYEVRAAHSPTSTRQWCSPESTAWTVVFEEDPRFQLSCLSRFVYVKAARNLAEVLAGADAVCGKVSTVGIAAAEDELGVLVPQLARWGVTRVCPVGQMQCPPLTWRHDGRPALGDLVTWTDWEH